MSNNTSFRSINIVLVAEICKTEETEAGESEGREEGDKEGWRRERIRRGRMVGSSESKTGLGT